MKGESYGNLELCVNRCCGSYYCHCDNIEKEVIE